MSEDVPVPEVLDQKSGAWVWSHDIQAVLNVTCQVCDSMVIEFNASMSLDTSGILASEQCRVPASQGQVRASVKNDPCTSTLPQLPPVPDLPRAMQTTVPPCPGAPALLVAVGLDSSAEPWAGFRAPGGSCPTGPPCVRLRLLLLPHLSGGQQAHGCIPVRQKTTRP